MLRSSECSSCTCRRKNWSPRFPFLTTTAPGVPKSASTKKVTWYVVVLAFPCFVFLPPLSAASALSFPFLVSEVAHTKKSFRLSGGKVKPTVLLLARYYHALTVINLRAAEQAQGCRLPGRQKPEGVGDDHRAIDGDGVLRLRGGRFPAPQLRAEGHLRGSSKCTSKQQYSRINQGST